MSQPRIVITAGEPAGVGPDVVLRALQFEHAARIAVIGDIGVLRDRADLLGISCDIHCLDKPEDVLPHAAGRLQVLHTPCVQAVAPGLERGKRALCRLNLDDGCRADRQWFV